MTELHKKTGISQNALSLLANGKSNGIQFNTLEKIIIITNSSIEDLLQYVGEQYTISVRSVAIDPIMGVPDIYDYEIIARDLENIKYSATLSFRISTEILNNRKIILISYAKRSGAFSNQLLNDFFFTAHNKGMLKVVSFLVATDLFLKLEIHDSPLNSMVIFTWFGFTPSEKGELMFSLPVDVINGNVLPDVNILKDEDFVGDINYDAETNDLFIETYIK